MINVYFVSLGCDKNRVDSEKMLAILDSHGMKITDEATEAEVIVVNTCSFIHDAKEESIETIIEMAKLKEEGKCQVLVATGCLAQRYADEMEAELPEVDVIVGTSAYDQIFEAISKGLEGKKEKILEDIDYLPKDLTNRIMDVSGYSSYIKIAEGCNKNCSYCIIPKLRGHYRSVPEEEVLKEAQILADNGTKELIIVAQETTVYGMDLYGEKTIHKLLEKLCKISGIEWIRILYCYPEEITKDLIETMAKEEKICNYLDLPIQHCNDRILKRMGRKTNKKDLIEKIKMIRQIIPDITLRTTLISGFPGESEKEHEECMEFVKEIEFDRLGVFPYSVEEGTKAAEYEDQIEEDIKRQRADEIMELQQDIIFKKNEKLVGQIVQVIVDGYLPEEDIYVGRTYRDAPDIDGNIFFKSDRQLISGSIGNVEIRSAKGYDLIGLALNY